MVIPETAERCFAEISARARTRTEESVVSNLAEVGPEPAPYGRRKAHLGSLDVLDRYVRSSQLLQKVFLRDPGTHFEILRQPGRKLDNLLVQERRPRLKGVCHACDIHLH